jgi:Asp-tRNA(Asn)/Glu-tRNA(Gln) amidotransferase B subunit
MTLSLARPEDAQDKPVPQIIIILTDFKEPDDPKNLDEIQISQIIDSIQENISFHIFREAYNQKYNWNEDKIVEIITEDEYDQMEDSDLMKKILAHICKILPSENFFS